MRRLVARYIDAAVAPLPPVAQTDAVRASGGAPDQAALATPGDGPTHRAWMLAARSTASFGVIAVRLGRVLARMAS